MTCEFGKMRLSKERTGEVRLYSTTKGNLPIVINKMTYDAFTLFI